MYYIFFNIWNYKSLVLFFSFPSHLIIVSLSFMPTGRVVDIYSKFDVIVSFMSLYLLFLTRTVELLNVCVVLFLVRLDSQLLVCFKASGFVLLISLSECSHYCTWSRTHCCLLHYVLNLKTQSNVFKKTHTMTTFSKWAMHISDVADGGPMIIWFSYHHTESSSWEDVQ